MQPGNGEDSPAFPKNNKPVQARSLSYMRMYSDIRVCPQLEIDRHPLLKNSSIEFSFDTHFSPAARWSTCPYEPSQSFHTVDGADKKRTAQKTHRSKNKHAS